MCISQKLALPRFLTILLHSFHVTMTLRKLYKQYLENYLRIAYIRNCLAVSHLYLLILISLLWILNLALKSVEPTYRSPQVLQKIM